MKTRHIYCNDKGFGLAYEDMPKIKDNQVLVKTVRSLPSVGTEISEQRKLKPGSKNGGVGYANVGRVIEVGKDVRRYSVGDRLLTYANHRDYFIIDPSDNPEYPWPITHPDIKMIFKLHPSVTNEEAAFTVIGGVALYFAEKAEITIGRTAVVIGLGTVGLLACQFAHLAGAVTVIGVDIDESRFALARELGVDHTITPVQMENLRELMAKRISGSAPPVYIEATGSAKAFRWATEAANITVGSTIVVGGNYLEEVPVSVDKIQHEQKIIGASAPRCPDDPVFSMPYNKQFNWNYILHQIAHKKLMVNKLYDGVITPEEAVNFYNAVLNNQPHLKQPLIAWE